MNGSSNDHQRFSSGKQPEFSDTLGPKLEDIPGWLKKLQPQNPACILCLNPTLTQRVGPLHATLNFPLPLPVDVIIPMEEKRAKALDALSTYIQSQRSLLERTNADIERLKELRDQVASHPSNDEDIVSQFLPQVAAVPKLSDYAEITATLPADFGWDLFAAQDPGAFKALTSNAIPSAGTPAKSAQPALTPLQQLVRDGRKAMVDNVIGSYPPLSSDEEEDPPDPEEVKRLLEREKIRELKKRRIHGGPALSGLGLRTQAYDGVHIRRDQMDESAEVDIWGADQEAAGPSGVTKSEVPISDVTFPTEVNTPSTSSIKTPGSVELGLPVEDPSRSARSRRPTRKAAENSQPPKLPTKIKGKGKPANNPPAIPDDEPDEQPPPESNLDKRGKPRPDTYKQAWSVSEQHLLERLLDEIPEGEKNRWAKISKAMNGRRTPRQVASRVQKYFEKLKRFGVDVGKS